MASKNPMQLSELDPAAEVLLQFVDKGKLAELYESLGWSVDEEIQFYIDLIRSADSPTLRLRALKQMAEMRKDIMQLSGMISKVTARMSEGGVREAQLSGTVLNQLLKSGPLVNQDPDPVTPAEKGTQDAQSTQSAIRGFEAPAPNQEPDQGAPADHEDAGAGAPSGAEPGAEADRTGRADSEGVDQTDSSAPGVRDGVDGPDAIPGLARCVS